MECQTDMTPNKKFNLTSIIHNRSYKLVFIFLSIPLLVYFIFKARGENIWIADMCSITLSLLVFYLVFSWGFVQWQKSKTLRNEKAKSELMRLKSQINPHFFFNTLNNLYSLIKKDQDIAQEYVLKLSGMMRFTIYEGGKEYVSLENELEYLKNFIELQTARYHKKITIEFKHNINNPKAPITPLLFIILLENAFKHGVEKLIDEAFVKIELFENNNEILFKVENNFDLKTETSESGIGLKNLKDRLSILYPNRHKLTISKNTTIYSVILKLSLV